MGPPNRYYTKIWNYNFPRLISFLFTIELWGSKRGRRGTTYCLLLDFFVLVVVRRVHSTFLCEVNGFYLNLIDQQLEIFWNIRAIVPKTKEQENVTCITKIVRWEGPILYTKCRTVWWCLKGVWRNMSTVNWSMKNCFHR